MLKSLYIEHGFKHHKKKLTFGEGLTAITGKNEAGKSLIMEFIRFALFGSKALRGAASDYKKLVVELEFDIRGKSYKVVRNPSRVALYELVDDKPDMVATGTTAVNSKIVELFGYGLLVFDVANACLQGSVESLGTMKPADRRKMVDDTVGLNLIDELIAYTKEQASIFRGKIEALEANLEPPVLPEETVLQDSDSLLQLVQKAEHDAAVEQRLRGRLEAATKSTAPRTEPQKPEGYYEPQRRERLAAMQRRIAAINEELRRLPGNVSVTSAELDEMQSQWQVVDAYEKRLAEYNRLPPEPKLRPQFIDMEEKLIGEHLAWKRAKNLWEQHKATCPKCEHEFVPSGSASDPGPWLGEEPKYREAELEAMRQAHRKREAFGVMHLSHPPVPTLTLAGIHQAREALKAEGRRFELLEELGGLEEAPEDFDERVAASMKYEMDKAAWEKADKIEDIKAELVPYQGADLRLIDLRKQYTDRRIYEAAVKAYDEAMKRLEVRKIELEESKDELEDHKNASKALTELKVKIKQHLLPSLARTASKLLKNMTGGERQLIEIDDAFNITVDSQPLTTLSGSAKAAANLAVRIGLGQVLTNKVFSVLLADEIDAAMDADRAEHTAASLRALTSEISQIILISHKRPEADAYVEL